MSKETKYPGLSVVHVYVKHLSRLSHDVDRAWLVSFDLIVSKETNIVSKETNIFILLLMRHTM